MKKMFLFLVLILISAGMAIAANCGNGIGACACGDTVTANYDMSGDLDCSGADALEIGADGIVLDCGGFSITSSTFNKTAVKTDEYDNITIRECTILNYATGISATDMFNFTMENNNLVNQSGSGVFMRNLIVGLLDSNNITGGGVHNVRASSVNNTTIKNNNISSSVLEPGLAIYPAEFNTIRDNVIKYNAKSGISLNIGAHNNLIENNKVYNNALIGITIVADSNNTVLSNDVQNHPLAGIYLQSASNIIVKNNKVLNNTAGIQVISESTGNNITLNNISNSDTIDLDQNADLSAEKNNFSVYTATEIANTISDAYDGGSNTGKVDFCPYLNSNLQPEGAELVVGSELLGTTYFACCDQASDCADSTSACVNDGGIQGDYECYSGEWYEIGQGPGGDDDVIPEFSNTGKIVTVVLALIVVAMIAMMLMKKKQPEQQE